MHMTWRKRVLGVGCWVRVRMRVKVGMSVKVRVRVATARVMVRAKVTWKRATAPSAAKSAVSQNTEPFLYELNGT